MLELLFKKAKAMIQDELVVWLDIVNLVKLASLNKFLRSSLDYHLYLSIHKDQNEFYSELLISKGNKISISDIINMFLK